MPSFTHAFPKDQSIAFLNSYQMLLKRLEDAIQNNDSQKVIEISYQLYSSAWMFLPKGLAKAFVQLKKHGSCNSKKRWFWFHEVRSLSHQLASYLRKNL